MEVKIAELSTKLSKDEEKINDHIEDFRAFQQEVRTHLKKIDEENVALHKLAVSIESLTKSLTETNDKIDKLSTKQEEMSTKISNIENAPAKKALSFNEELKNKILIGVILGAVGFFIGLFLPFTL